MNNPHPIRLICRFVSHFSHFLFFILHLSPYHHCLHITTAIPMLLDAGLFEMNLIARHRQTLHEGSFVLPQY